MRVLVLVTKQEEFNQWQCGRCNGCNTSSGLCQRDLDGDRRIILICGPTVDYDPDRIAQQLIKVNPQDLVVVLIHPATPDLCQKVEGALSQSGVHFVRVDQYSGLSPNYSQIERLARGQSDANEFDNLWIDCADPYSLMYEALMPLVAKVLENPNQQIQYDDEILKGNAWDAWNKFWSILRKNRIKLDSFRGKRLIEVCQSLRDVMLEAIR